MIWPHWLDVVLVVGSAVAIVGLVWVGWGPAAPVVWLDELRVGRRRLIALIVLCSLGSTLWIGSPAWIGAIPLMPDADLTWRLIGYGLLIPWGVGAATLLWMEWRISRELCPAGGGPPPEHDHEEELAVQPDRGEVLEGEVLPR